MIFFEIENAGEFMNSLFVQEWLDHMELVEGEITTFYNIKIDGKRYPQWYDSMEQQQETRSERITWKEYKKQAFSLIKGKKVPLLFRFVMKLPKKETEALLKEAGIAVLSEDIHGVYLNIKYEKKRLHITTGVSLQKFFMDKTLEHTWDDMVVDILKKHGFFLISEREA